VLGFYLRNWSTRLKGGNMLLKRFAFSFIFVIVFLTTAIYAQDSSQFQQGNKAFVQGDGQSALKILLPIADAGNRDAQYMVARMYEMGPVMYKGVKADMKKSGKYYMMAAKGGNAEAQFKIGFCYHKGLLGYPRNENKRNYWYCKGALQGNEEAVANIEMYLSNWKSKCPDVVLNYKE